MGYQMSKDGVNAVFKQWLQTYDLIAPKRFEGDGAFSDTDLIRYGEIQSVEEIEFEELSRFSFKKALTPLSQTLFYFTEETVKEADISPRSMIVFLRSCDLHAVKRLDAIYLHNRFEDYYYRQLRDKVKFVLIGCKTAFENCFCVDMGANQTDEYHASIEPDGDAYLMDCKLADWDKLLSANSLKKQKVTPSYVTETPTRVSIPEGLSIKIAGSQMWDEYDSRCINCGRCTFVCPTCTCFTMQDVYYTENGKVGERRRVWASCMVDGFTDVAGGGSYRQKNGERMRFRVLHKVYDFKQRFGFHMCVGCGRCDDACPEYISFSHAVNRLADAVKEVNDASK